MDHTEKTMSCNDIYRGRIIYVHVDDVELADGTRTKREIVEHHGGVAVLPLDADGTVTCVRQYRYAYRTELLELPAGKLEAGEDPLECAKPELSEETGFTAENYVYLGHLYPSPGYCSEVLHLYLATGLKQGKAHLDTGELLDVERHSLDELLGMVMRDELHDAKTVAAILKTKQYLVMQG